MKKERTYVETVNHVGLITIIWNVILSGFKFVAGILGNSTSMISDAVHSASDVFTTIIVMIGAKISMKKADATHPYGHEKIESLASFMLAVLLAATALSIGYSGVNEIIAFAKGSLKEKNDFTWIALTAAVSSIAIKGIMFFYTNSIAKKIHSNSLKADGYHHLSDSLSSIGSLLGIIGILLGSYWAIMDPIASLLICIFILKVSYNIMASAVNQLVDHSASQDESDRIRTIILSNPQVKGIEDCKTRKFGNRIYVDVDINLDKNLSLIHAHEIANEVHDLVEKDFPDCKHCMVHFSPDEIE